MEISEFCLLELVGFHNDDLAQASLAAEIYDSMVFKNVLLLGNRRTFAPLLS